MRITSNPGETFLDRMIALVEGAQRQKTPNEIALNIVIAGLTLVFLLAVVTLQPFAVYSGAPQTIFVLISLLVCLIPTTIGGLLSAIGIAGMDRLVQHNVLATSGRPYTPWGLNYGNAGRLIEDFWEADWPTFQQLLAGAEKFAAAESLPDAFREYCRAMRVLAETFHRQRHKGDGFSPVWEK